MDPASFRFVSATPITLPFHLSLVPSTLHLDP